MRYSAGRKHATCTLHYPGCSLHASRLSTDCSTHHSSTLQILLGSSSKQSHLNLVRSCLQLRCVLLVGPMCSSTILSHFMHVGGPDLDLHGHPTWTLHCCVQGLVPRSLGIHYVVIVLTTNLPPEAMDSWLNPAMQYARQQESRSSCVVVRYVLFPCKPASTRRRSHVACVALDIAEGLHCMLYSCCKLAIWPGCEEQETVLLAT